MSKSIKDIENSLGEIRCKLSFTVYALDPEPGGEDALEVDVQGPTDQLEEIIIHSMFENKDLEQLIVKSVGKFLTLKMLGNSEED